MSYNRWRDIAEGPQPVRQTRTVWLILAVSVIVWMIREVMR